MTTRDASVPAACNQLYNNRTHSPRCFGCMGCSWITSQNSSKAGELWIDGARDYIKYAEGLLNEYKDVASGEHRSSAATRRSEAIKLSVLTCMQRRCKPSFGVSPQQAVCQLCLAHIL